MGSSIDALKLVSSLTLFGHVARKLHAAEGLAAYGRWRRAGLAGLKRWLSSEGLAGP